MSFIMIQTYLLSVKIYNEILFRNLKLVLSVLVTNDILVKVCLASPSDSYDLGSQVFIIVCLIISDYWNTDT